MKKIISILSAVCFLSLSLIVSDLASAAPSIIPTDKSAISAIASDSGIVILKSGGDLAGKFGWVEVYYKTPQEGGKFIRRFSLDGDSVAIQKESVVGFNFGKGDWEYLMLDEYRGFPGKLSGLVMIKGEEGKGAKLGFQ